MAEQSSSTWTAGGGAAAPGTGTTQASGTGTSGASGTPGGAASSPGDLREKVVSKVAAAADTQKNRAAESLGTIAAAARHTGDELRGQSELLASWVSSASDQLRHLADRLRDRPAAELADDLSRFARERPAVFLGGAFLLGLGVARLLKSSPDRAWHGGNGDTGMRQARHARDTGLGTTAVDRPDGDAWASGAGAY